MKLVSVYDTPGAVELLYALLKERPSNASISHRTLPSWEEHCAFVASHPYAAWYLIEVGEPVGSVYLTRNREVGIFIFRAHAGRGYGEAAVRLLMQLHPGRLLANVSPMNAPSHAMFQGMGGRLIQWTYEIGAST